MSPRPALCLSLYLQNRQILLVGSGSACEERAQRLLAAGATLVHCDEENWRSHCDGQYFAAMANSEDDGVNREVALWARANHILAYAHDQPEISDFAFPALVKRGPLQIAIATGGQAPALAGQLRRQFQELLDRSQDVWEPLLTELVAYRSETVRGPERMRRLISLAKQLRIAGRLERIIDS